MTTPHYTLVSLPEEVISNIVAYIPDQTLLWLSETCTKLNRICSSPLELRQRCLKFKYWEERHQISKKFANPTPTQIDWKRLFIHRFNVDRITTEILEDIIEYPTDRITRFNKLADFGYDAKDCLARHANVRDDEVSDPLARRWHARAAISYIHRRRGLQIMKRLSNDDDVPLETALSSLELFDSTDAAYDEQGTAAMLDELADRFLHETPEFSHNTVSGKAEVLIRWMWKEGYVGTPPEHYRALKNVFIGLTLRTVHSAIPLTLVAIFSGISRRIGLVTYPCAYPGHMYAIVVDENAEHLYYDLFDEQADPRVTPEMMAARSSEVQPQRSFLQPAHSRDMAFRMAQNILATLQLQPLQQIQHNHGYPHVCENSVLYAALTAIVIIGFIRVRSEMVHHLIQQITQNNPMDVRFLEEEVLPRIEDEPQRGLLSNVCNALRSADSEAKAVSRRDTRENRAVLVPYYPSECFLCHAHLANLALRLYGEVEVENLDRRLVPFRAVH